jgi:hypothetical protein
MRSVLSQWPISCEQNLSHTTHNRIAWLGQAAVCLATGQPSAVTRSVWWELTKDQQDRANAGAAETIRTWEGDQCLGNQLELTY